MSTFIPRAVFPTLDSLPRSYYLGHHAAGLAKMRTMLSQIDLIVECRDYRIPLTSRNPMFEDSLAGRERMVVYTKKDLGSNGAAEDVKVYMGRVGRCGKLVLMYGIYVEAQSHSQMARTLPGDIFRPQEPARRTASA